MIKGPGARSARLEDIAEPAWIWDMDRARIIDANAAALLFWNEPSHVDLLEREFDPEGPLALALERESNRLGDGLVDTVLPLPLSASLRQARCEASHHALPGGRRGILIKVLGENDTARPEDELRHADMARHAPAALMTCDVTGRITSENAASIDIFGQGRTTVLAQRIGSSRIANALIEETLIHGRASRTRSIPTRVGPRLCRLNTRRGEDPVSKRPSILVQTIDVEDLRAHESDLQSQVEALNAFLETGTDFYFELDYDLRIVRASDGLAERLNLGDVDLSGAHWRDLASQQGFTASRDIELAMGARSGWRDQVMSVAGRDQRWKYLTSACVLSTDRGDFRGYRIVGRDVEQEEDHLAEVTTLSPKYKLQDQPTDFSEILGAAPWAIAIHRNFTPVYFNTAFTEIFGLEDNAKEKPGDIPLMRFFPDGQRGLREDYERLMKDDLAFAVRELNARRLDNREMTIQLRARRVEWQGAFAIEYVLEDMTNYRQARRSGEERAEIMTAVLDMVPEAILLLRRNGLVDWANLGALRLLELPDAGPPPHDISDVLSPEDTGWAQDYIAGLADGGLTRLFSEGREVTVVNASGQRVPALMALDRIKIGETVKVCAVLRDISEWRRAESKVEEVRDEAASSSGRKTEFLAKVSHELRTPLTAILGFAQVMAREELGPIGNSRYVEYANDILNSGDHLLSLINDLLDMSKVETGNFDLSFDSVHLHEIAEGCVRLMSPVAGSRQVTLRSMVPEGLPAVVADARSLRQVLLNLISNALRFTEPGGDVRVTAVPDDNGGLTLAVTDTGVGMSEEELAVALEPFEQVEKAVANGTPGTGLGLPLARALTEANRAFFRIQSTPQSGTTVAITFPSTQVLDE